LFLYAAFSEVFRPYFGVWVACISYLHLLVQKQFTQAPMDYSSAGNAQVALNDKCEKS
jgi:hypothetical protein